MNFRNLLFIGACFLNLSAHAETELSYGSISKQFASGQKPELSRYVGKMNAGRCFNKSQPNQELAAYFVVDSKVNSGSKIFAGFIGVQLDLPPNFYENPDISVSRGSYFRIPIMNLDNKTMQIIYPDSKDILNLRSYKGTIVIEAHRVVTNESYFCSIFHSH